MNCSILPFIKDVALSSSTICLRFICRRVNGDKEVAQFHQEVRETNQDIIALM